MKKEVLANSWCMVWSKSNSLYVRWAERNNINYFVFLVLYMLDTHGTLKQNDIWKSLGASKQTINSTIRKMQTDGLVFLEVNKKDHRAKEIVLTEKGKQLAGDVLKPLYEIEERVVKNISEERCLEMFETIRLYNILFENEME